jgi:hypothetical protein
VQAFKTINSKNWELSQIQGNTGTILDILTQIPFLDGVMLKSQVIDTTDTVLNHGLGRAPLGFVIMGKNGLGDIYQTASSQFSLTLKSSVQVTANVWVY